MIDTNIKDSIKECIVKNGLKYTLQMYTCICSESTIRGIERSMRNNPHIITYPHVYSEEELKNEYLKIQSLPGNYSMVWNKNKNIYHFQPHYFRDEMLFLSKEQNYNLILENRKKYLFKSDINMKEMLRGCKISGHIRGYSHFSPLIIKKFISDNNIKSIYDPCGGWGHRLIGVGDLPYIYNDLWVNSCKGVKGMVSLHNIKNKTIYNKDCTLFTPIEEYESVFTCPPYFNKEIYSNEFKTLEDYKSFLIQMVVSSFIKKSSARILGIVICHDYVSMLQNILSDLSISNQIITIHKNRNHFERAETYISSNEYLVLGIKV